MKYPYFRGLEADRYSFYRVPKALIKVDLFEKMSGDAKLLYAVLLDRMNLSLKNGWQDENGNAYIICSRCDRVSDDCHAQILYAEKSGLLPKAPSERAHAWCVQELLPFP